MKKYQIMNFDLNVRIASATTLKNAIKEADNYLHYLHGPTDCSNNDQNVVICEVIGTVKRTAPEIVLYTEDQ